MNTSAPAQTKESLDQATLLFASRILNDVRQLTRGIRAIAAFLRHFAALSTSIKDGLLGWTAPAALEKA